jgi:hypothetical protein
MPSLGSSHIVVAFVDGTRRLGFEVPPPLHLLLLQVADASTEEHRHISWSGRGERATFPWRENGCTADDARRCCKSFTAPIEGGKTGDTLLLAQRIKRTDGRPLTNCEMSTLCAAERLAVRLL